MDLKKKNRLKLNVSWLHFACVNFKMATNGQWKMIECIKSRYQWCSDNIAYYLQDIELQKKTLNMKKGVSIEPIYFFVSIDDTLSF